jgi:hypothetical protein
MPPFNRRHFLGAAALGAAALSTLRSRAADAPAPAAPRTVKLGLIGCGWWAMVNAKGAYKAGGAQVIAICDIDNAPHEKTAL